MMTLLLAARDPADLLQNSDFLWLVGALAVTLLLGAIVMSIVERWRKRQLASSNFPEIEQIGKYRAMYENGELTKEEYEKIRRKEAERLKAKLAVKSLVTLPDPVEPPVQPSAQEPKPPPPQA